MTQNKPEEQKGSEEKKIWPLIGYAPGNYMNTCAYCKKQMQKVDKLCFMCLECAVSETHKYVVHLEKRERLLSTLVPNPESIASAPTMYAELQSLRQERDRLKEAATKLLNLHMAEQEGLLSGQPTAAQWYDAVNKLSEAINQ